MGWRIEFHEKALEEFYELADSLMAKFIELFENIETNGFSAISPKSVKNIENGIIEFRVKGKDGIARSLYATTIGQRIDILLVFVKKTEETPRRYIELAKKEGVRFKMKTIPLKEVVTELMKKPGFAEAREQARRELEEEISLHGTIGNPKPTKRQPFAKKSRHRFVTHSHKTVEA